MIDMFIYAVAYILAVSVLALALKKDLLKLDKILEVIETEAIEMLIKLGEAGIMAGFT